MTEAWAPACMDSEEFADWSRFNVRLSKRVDRPCADCLPAFAAEMAAEDRCNGVPTGHVKEEGTMPEPITLAGKRHAVTVTVPCATCAHAEVCRIRPSIEGVRSLTVIAPEADAAVSFSVSDVVSCEHYAKGKAPKPLDSGEPDADRPKRTYTPEALERMRENGRRLQERRRELAAS